MEELCCDIQDGQSLVDARSIIATASIANGSAHHCAIVRESNYVTVVMVKM